MIYISERVGAEQSPKLIPAGSTPAAGAIALAAIKRIRTQTQDVSDGKGS